MAPLETRRSGTTRIHDWPGGRVARVPGGANIFARKPAKTAAWAAEQLEKARNPRHDPLSLFS